MKLKFLCFVLIIMSVNLPLSYAQRRFKCCNDVSTKQNPGKSCASRFAIIEGEELTPFPNTIDEALNHCFEYDCVVEYKRFGNNKRRCHSSLQPPIQIPAQCILPIPDSEVDQLQLVHALKQRLEILSYKESLLFIKSIHQSLIKQGETIPNKSEYDIIIVGAGIAGTQAALLKAHQYKVLVIDAKIYPSSFGVGEFFLNTGKINGILDHNAQPLLPPSVMGNWSYKNEADPASKMTHYLLMNLFVSGADVILGHKVMKAFVSKKPHFPVAITTDHQQTFFAKKIIEALGPGVPFNPFSETIHPGEDPNILFEDDFLAMVRDGEANDFLKDQRVAIIGGGAGGQISVLAAKGMNPLQYQAAQGHNPGFFEVNPEAQPTSILWAGQRAALDLTGFADSPILELPLTSIRLIKRRAEKLIPTDQTRYRLMFPKGKFFEVDKVILSTGRKPAPSIWNEEQAESEDGVVQKIQYHPGDTIIDMLTEAQKLSKQIHIQFPMPYLSPWRKRLEMLPAPIPLHK
jgi:hypothetical protein